MSVRSGSRQRDSALVAILAGGRGRRLGGEKALVELGGRTLISYPLQAARAAGLEALTVAKRDSPLPPLEAPVLCEPDHPRHPLCGVVAALQHVRDAGRSQRPVLVLACDMPFVSAALLGWLARRHGETVAVEVTGRVQPFPALYRPAQLERLEAELAAARPLRATLELLQATVVSEQTLRAFGEPRRLCFSVNEPADLQAARRCLAS